MVVRFFMSQQRFYVRKTGKDLAVSFICGIFAAGDEGSESCELVVCQ
jgi:hypothetical protein